MFRTPGRRACIEIAGFVDAGCAPGREELVAPAERHGAEAEHGDLESRTTKQSIIHTVCAGPVTGPAWFLISCWFAYGKRAPTRFGPT